MAKEIMRSMTEEMLPVTDMKAKLPDGGYNTVAGASSYQMFLNESSNTMIRIYFDLESMNQSFNIIKLATQKKISFILTAESGLELNFDAIVVGLGKNHATFQVKRKSIADMF